MDSKQIYLLQAIQRYDSILVRHGSEIGNDDRQRVGKVCENLRRGQRTPKDHQLT